jgi:hypothetical protein
MGSVSTLILGASSTSEEAMWRRDITSRFIVTLSTNGQQLPHRQPAKTEEEFFTDVTGRRWFKTGDIGEVTVG